MPVDVATLNALSDRLATELLDAGAEPEQALLACGLIGAKVIAQGRKADKIMPGPEALARVMQAGFNSGMMLETTGQFDPTNKVHLGVAR